MQLHASRILFLILILVLVLHLAGPFHENSASMQRTFRIHLHTVTHVLSAVLFVASSRRATNPLFTSFWPRFTPIESLLSFGIWQASYPVLAATPLALSLPLQLFTLAVYIPHNRTLCSAPLGVGEHTVSVYAILQRIANKLALILPFSLNSTKHMHFSRDLECHTLLVLTEVALLIIVSSYLCFGMELARRLAFCAATERYELQFELWKRRTPVWKMIMEVIVASSLAWNMKALLTMLSLPFWQWESPK